MWGVLRGVFQILSTVGLGWMVSDIHKDFEPSPDPNTPIQQKGIFEQILSWIGNNKLTFGVIAASVIAYFYFTHKNDNKK